MKIYLEVKENSANITHLRVELRYSLGGYNNFISETEKRGYHLSVTPVEMRKRDNGYTSEAFVIFSGVKRCIKEVSRKSASAEAEAEALVPDIATSLIDYVCRKNHLHVKDEELNKLFYYSKEEQL